MVRIWMFRDVKQLMQKRFLGQHLEVEIILNVNLSKRCWRHHMHLLSYLHKTHGYVPNRQYRNHPEVLKHAGNLGALVDLHDNVLVPDFLRRGYNHQSPLVTSLPHPNCNVFDYPKQTYFSIVSDEEYLRDKQELAKRQISENN
jgi:hypothetical protein